MRHLSVLRGIKGVRPVAIPNRPERAEELIRGGYDTAQSLEEVVNRGATLCVIATDTGRHVKDVVAAVENGLDALVEKPLSTDAAQANVLCRKATESGRKIFVGCVLRFSESLNQFHNLLGSIGHVHSVRIECQSYLPEWRPGRPYRDSYSARQDEGGVLRDLIHEVDYAGWLFGWPRALQARVRNTGRLGIAADEAADLLWETVDECVVSISLDYLTRPSRRQMRASGESGTLEWDGIEDIVAVALPGQPSQFIRSAQTPEGMLLAQDLEFIQVCRGGASLRLATAEDGVKALAVCDAARRAAESRREEVVEYL